MQQRKRSISMDRCIDKVVFNFVQRKKNLVSQRKLKTLKHMWKLISEEMAIHNYHITATQAENKMKTMDTAYKNMISNNKRTGRGRATCNFEDDLNDILGKKHNIVPLVISSSSGLTVRKNDNEESATPTSISLPLMIPEPEEEDSHESEKKRIKKISKTIKSDEILETVLQEIKINRRSREEYQERMMGEFQNFMENTIEHREKMKHIAEKS
ncbi:uncharacterized protein LOC122511939 [Leptopilina heterotoma]|uniref:uncharacterized protein LOC122511939 n=1 Tax=Leptopilina heterotoma TaxID=63436 RepID=UPI001CA89BE3|nr:uncharacterized protein LOC122511939 [Leptopilina heterotoma]XP_043483446.1 uncharacterized protein LOC122511939 [Leptopilina heterotoma]XP_043483448.1 uncharacterized protein LOC122511939 [Leptopilina heterotoma]